MEIKQYVDYIKECRKRGFEDLEIKNSLIEKGWPVEDIDKAFNSLDKNKKVKKEDSEKKKETEKKKEDSKEDKYYQNMVDIKEEKDSEENEGNEEYQEERGYIVPKKQDYESEEQDKYKSKYTQEVYGSSVTVFLDDELRTALQKRAKKNMFNLQEQIEDILRRSTLNLKGKKYLPDEKLDDKLVGVFSRRNTGQKTKKKKVKKEKKSTKELTREKEKRNKRRSKSLKKHYKKDRIKVRKEKRIKKRAERRVKRK
jgi:hypothetical protein